MNERLDAILTEYEDAWRAAALSGEPQGCAPVENSGRIEGGLCAWLLVCRELQNEARGHPLKWRCPLCGYDSRGLALNSVMVHLNDAHRWTWDMFANKFRDALAQGMAK